MDGQQSLGSRRICTRSILGRWMMISVARAATIEALRETRPKFDGEKLGRITSH